MKKGKRYQEAEKLVDRKKLYSAKEALETIKNNWINLVNEEKMKKMAKNDQLVKNDQLGHKNE